MELLINLQRERDRGEKSTGEQGENGETIHYLLTLEEEKTVEKNIFFVTLSMKPNFCSLFL